MFEIKFKIIDDIEILKKISLTKFEQECAADIRGLFLLNFNGKKYGYFEHDLPPEVENLFEEWLITWFYLLNEVVRKLILDEHVYVALHPIEDAYTWIEFKKNKQDESLLIVSLIEIKQSSIGHKNVIVTKPFDTYVYGSWNNTKVTLNEFRDEVIKKTQSLIDFIRDTNFSLLENKGIQRLTNYIEILKHN